MEYDIKILNDEAVYYYKKSTKILHREDGPAVEFVFGMKVWYINGRRHKEDGPAVEYTSGSKEWWVNGVRHRADGPAIEWHNGNMWFIDGTRLPPEKEIILNKWWCNKNGI